MGDLSERLAMFGAALRGHQWGRLEWSAHSKHRFHMDCAICQGDVDAMVAVGAPLLAEHIAAETRADERRKVAAALREIGGRKVVNVLALRDFIGRHGLSSGSGISAVILAVADEIEGDRRG